MCGGGKKREIRGNNHIPAESGDGRKGSFEFVGNFFRVGFFPFFYSRFLSKKE